MKPREILRLESAYQARCISIWLCFAVLFAFAFLLGRSTLTDGEWLNSPFGIAFVTVLVGAVWLASPLTYTVPIGKAGYLEDDSSPPSSSMP